MAKVTFSKLKLNKETEITKVMIGEVEIEVKHYIPISEKILTLDTVVRESVDYNYVNKAKADALLHVYMLMCYTNINFSKKERDSIMETYDILERNGVIDAVVCAIPKDEYDSFIAYCDESMNDYNKYKNSLVGIAEKLLNELPTRLDGVNDIMKSFNPDDLKVLSGLVSRFGGSESAITDTIMDSDKNN